MEPITVEYDHYYSHGPRLCRRGTKTFESEQAAIEWMEQNSWLRPKLIDGDKSNEQA